MKATDTKSSARTAHQQQQQSAGNTFFNKEGSSSFFGEPDAAPKPFFVQRKLTVGEPNDHFEKQADHVADKVVQRMSKPAAPVPPVKGEELQKKEEDVPATEEKIQRKPIFDSMGDTPPDDTIRRKSDAKSEAPSGIEQRLKNTKGSGTPLPAETKTAMESSIGADFSGVRVHTGKEAAALSNDLQAQAFTHGNDIYFNEGKFDATSSSGRHLLAHELTHTVQQGAAIQKKSDQGINSLSTNSSENSQVPNIQRDPAPAAAAATASGEVVNISSGAFNPSANLLEEIRATKNKGLDVNITAGKVAGAGTIKVREKDGVLESLKNAYLPLNMPMFSAANPTLAVRLANGQVSGFGTIGQSNAPDAIPAWLKKNGTALAWLTGIDVESITSKATNTFENGAFVFTLNGVKVKVGGFANATMDVGFDNMQPTAHVVADMDIKGMVQGNLDINLKDNQMSGQGSFGVNYKSFAGNIEAKFLEGVLDVKGTVSYSGDKLSGSITLLMTDKATADNFATSQLGGAKPEDAAMPEAVPAAEGKGPRGMAGMGNLTFNLTEWFAGSVNVIVDGKGFVTVVGKIAPPKEIVLFEQKDYSKELFKMEARAAYGIPVLGNVFVFANMALIAMAKVGPAKIYNIEVNGTYSNNPDIAKEISLSGSLNMSAYAGLRLRAEGGAGIELAGHDLKVGVGVNADEGVKGYVDARPTIGYRDPGEFFFKGHMEIAAQPFLGLSGDLFVELDSPWWSPLPDKKWTWPIGALEYPLPGEFGIGADMEYVLGSGKVPEVTFSEAKFDGGKFMTDLVDDHVPQKGGGDKKDKAGKFTDGGAAAPAPGKGAPPPPAGGKGGAPPAKGAGGKGKDKDKGKENPDEMKNFAAAMKKVKELEGHKPMTKEEITAAVENIKKQFSTPTISVAPKGTDLWMVTGTMKGKPNKQSVKVKADMKPGDDKDKKGDDKEKDKKLAAGVEALKAEDKKVSGDGKMNSTEAHKVATGVAATHKDAIKSVTVMPNGDNWDYTVVQRMNIKPQTPHVVGAKIEKTLPDGLVPNDVVLYGRGKERRIVIGLREFNGQTTVEGRNAESNSPTYTPLAYFRKGIDYIKEENPKNLLKLKAPPKPVPGQPNKWTYETVQGKVFEYEVDNTDRVQKIKGFKLTTKPAYIKPGARGHVSNIGVNLHGGEIQRGHLIADQFGGSGLAGAYNIVATSKEYNKMMLAKETEIDKMFTTLKANYMDIQVSITSGILTSQVVVDKFLASLNGATIDKPEETKAKIKAQVTMMKTKDMERVLNTKYNVAFFDTVPAQIGHHAPELGADLYYKV